MADTGLFASFADNTSNKSKLKRFDTDQERKEAASQRQRGYDHKRIQLGSAFDEWELHRVTCGYRSQAEFAKHLLAFHETRCSMYTRIRSASQAKLEALCADR